MPSHQTRYSYMPCGYDYLLQKLIRRKSLHHDTAHTTALLVWGNSIKYLEAHAG